MDEVPATPLTPSHEQENVVLMTRMERSRGKFTAYVMFLRLLLVFACGLLLGFLTGGLLPPVLDATIFSYPSWASWLGSEGSTALVLLVPPGLGIAVAFMGGRRSDRLFSCALGRVLLAWAGTLIYWYLIYGSIDETVSKAVMEDCARVNNHGYCGLERSLTPIGIFIYLIFSVCVMLLLATMTTFNIRMMRRHKASPK